MNYCDLTSGIKTCPLVLEISILRIFREMHIQESGCLLIGPDGLIFLKAAALVNYL